MGKRRAPDTSSAAGASRPSKRRAISDKEAVQSFRSGLLSDETRIDYQKKYMNAQPYKHGVIQNLLDPDLLRSVRSEIRNNISFTPKETDIYKIHQSGDLANLDGLDDSSLKLLPSLVKIRDALYSAPFRDYLSKITGAGALSGTKTDMAVNVYNPTCHLLCHDDVIGSRRVSYILYLTDPDVPWQAEWGGALRLYPTHKMHEADGSETKVPDAQPTTIIPPAFNQLSFFAVQPGESFHDVEEVYSASNESDALLDSNGKSKYTEEERRHVESKGKFKANDESNMSRVRMAISGWFHIPQVGENGFEEGAQEKQAAKSSLAQLQGKGDKYDLPQFDWQHLKDHSSESTPFTPEELTEEDLTELLRFMNPQYLTPDVVEQMWNAFSEESVLTLSSFLNQKFAAEALKAMEEEDEKAADDQWKVARPPHKHRFLYRQLDPSKSHAPTPMNRIVAELMHSAAFCKWLSLVSGCSLGDYHVEARRFRRGMDYTLATSHDEVEPQLELCLGLTPTPGWALDAETDAEDGAPLPEPQSTEPKDDVGGYEVWMAGEAEDEEEEENAQTSSGAVMPSSSTGAGNRRQKADPAVYLSGGDDEDDGILLTAPASWNSLGIVLRDKGTLKFVKYVSRSARGDRFDVVANFKVTAQVEESERGSSVDAERGIPRGSDWRVMLGEDDGTGNYFADEHFGDDVGEGSENGLLAREDYDAGGYEDEDEDEEEDGEDEDDEEGESV